MTADSIRRYYDRAASTYDATRLPFLVGRQAGVEALGLLNGLQVLEIGAGTGYNIGPIVSAIGSGTLTLLDFSVGMLRRARQKSRSSSQIRYVASDANQFCLRTRFDRILFSYSLSLMPDPLSALRTARDHLADKGIIVVVDFGPMPGWGPVRKAVRWWLGNHSVVPIHEDIHRFKDEAPALTVTLENLGYTLLAKIPA